jgi:superfamily I DNA/RNA helicase
MSGDYLGDLNKEQRRAVKYGNSDQGPFRSGPVLVIAGAGQGRRRPLPTGLLI